MFDRSLRALLFSLPFAAVACGVLPDVRLGKDANIPPISGSTTISIPQDYMCGDPIMDSEGKYTVKSSGDASSCTFTFNQKVTAIKASDYDSNPQLEGAQVVNGVDIDVTKFAFVDPATGKQPDNLRDLTGKAFDEVILTKEDLTQTLPFTKKIRGAAVDALKDQVQAKEDIIIPVDVVVVVSLPPPAQLRLDFEAQPNLIIGF